MSTSEISPGLGTPSLYRGQNRPRDTACQWLIKLVAEQGLRYRSHSQRSFHKLENSQATLSLLPLVPWDSGISFFSMSITILWSQCYHSNTGSYHFILDWLSQPPNWSSLPPLSPHKIAFYTMHTAAWIGPNTAFTLLLNTLSRYPHVYKTNFNSLVINSRGLFQSYFPLFPNTHLSSSTHLIASFFLQIRLALSYLCTLFFLCPTLECLPFLLPLSLSYFITKATSSLRPSLQNLTQWTFSSLLWLLLSMSHLSLLLSFAIL